jgi:hypothetical protein
MTMINLGGTGWWDLNFYPEHHMDELDGLLDLEVPQGRTVGGLVERLHDARLMLWSALNKVDDDGNVVPTWK